MQKYWYFPSQNVKCTLNIKINSLMMAREFIFMFIADQQELGANYIQNLGAPILQQIGELCFGAYIF